MKNPYLIEGDIVKVFITTKEGVEVTAVADAEDIGKIAPYRWHAAKQRDGYRIVCHMRLEPKGPKRAIYMHRVVMDAPPKVFIDHINCDPSDNRKSNLRYSDYRANGQNRSKLHPTNTSGAKNVTWAKKYQKWQAMFTVNGRGKFLGYFTEIEDAAKAVIEARKKYMPFSQEAMQG